MQEAFASEPQGHERKVAWLDAVGLERDEKAALELLLRASLSSSLSPSDHNIPFHPSSPPLLSPIPSSTMSQTNKVRRYSSLCLYERDEKEGERELTSPARPLSLLRFFSLQATFLREYKLVVVGGGGKHFATNPMLSFELAG